MGDEEREGEVRGREEGEVGMGKGEEGAGGGKVEKKVEKGREKKRKILSQRSARRSK